MTIPAQSYFLDTTWRTLFKDIGVVPANAFRRAGLSDDLLLQGTVRLAPERYYRLWDSIEAETGHQYFPIRLCEVVRSESFSPLLFAALCSPNLLLALQRIAQYKALIGPMTLKVEETHDVVTMELVWLDIPQSPPVSMVVAELLFYVTLGRMGTREPLYPVKVTTNTLPSPLAPYEAFLGNRIQQAAKHTLVFSHADAARPFLTSNETIWSAFEPELRQRLADLVAPVTTCRRVRAALLESLPSGLVSMDDVARKLAMSKRTLQRRIEAEGMSFQQIVKQTRESLARHYLEKTALPTAEIAFLLGFDELSSFYRAFRSWTGTTPDSVRQLGSSLSR